MAHFGEYLFREFIIKLPQKLGFHMRRINTRAFFGVLLNFSYMGKLVAFVQRDEKCR